MDLVALYPVGDGRGEEDLCHVRSGGRSVIVPSGGWGGIFSVYPVGDAQWLTSVGDGNPVGDGRGRRISAMYAVGDTQWLMRTVRSGGHSVADVPSGG